MRIAVSGLHLRLGEDPGLVPVLAAERLGIPADTIVRWRLLKRSLDARGRREPRFVCTVGLELRGELGLPDVAGVSSWDDAASALKPPTEVPTARPLIVGAGPAGLFAALRLCGYGFRPIVIERGKPVSERVLDVSRYWKDQVLDPESNVQFGEGGAGTFSDGKLTYRGKDFRKGWVFDALVAAGAPEELLWDSKPHLGTDRLRGVLRRLRETLLNGGVDFRFRTRAEGLLFEDERVVGVATNQGPVLGSPVFLAPGHSARDLYAALQAQGGRLEPKGFAVGLRVELPQEMVDRCQYGPWAGHEDLPRAEFAVMARSATGRDVYSFCMCPGGVVIPAGSEHESLVVNGMSAHGRTGRWANAALVASLAPADFSSANGGPLAGIELQRQAEQRAWQMGQGRRVPAQTLRDFLKGVVSSGFGPTSCPWELTPASLADCLPSAATAALRDTLPRLLSQLPPLGDGVLMGVETRTSSPVRIARGEDMESLVWSRVYPIGEGAGYAGGIVSAAIDGARGADAFAATLGAGVEARRAGD